MVALPGVHRLSPGALDVQIAMLNAYQSGTEKGTPNNFYDKDFAELSGELSGAICLKALVLLGGALELFRKFFGAVRAFFWALGFFFGS